MILIKTSFQINDQFLNNLLRLINGEIEHVSSWGNDVNFESPDKIYDNIFFISSFDNVRYGLSLRSLFFYNENIDDDVTSFRMSFVDDSNLPPRDVKSFFISGKVFKIHKIKIYGEERIRIWSEMKKIQYFQKKVDIQIADYYFNNKIIRFESSDDRFVNIYVYKDFVCINIDKKLNFENDFYMVSDLNMEENFVNNRVWTNVKKIKCHYEIDIYGIKKYINHEITLHG